jgi:hypothetical protein
MTDVPLREHLIERIDALDRHLTRELTDLREDASTAVRAAEKANDLARTVKEATAQRLGRIESWQAKLTGGMLVLAVIGITNLTKLWFG